LQHFAPLVVPVSLRLKPRQSYFIHYWLYLFRYTFCLHYLFIYYSKSAGNELVKKTAPAQFYWKISYGMYVYHLPIYLILSTQFSKIISGYINTGPNATTIWVSLLSVVITIAASTISFYFLEKPILSLKKHFA